MGACRQPDIARAAVPAGRRRDKGAGSMASSPCPPLWAAGVTPAANPPGACGQAARNKKTLARGDLPHVIRRIKTWRRPAGQSFRTASTNFSPRSNSWTKRPNEAQPGDNKTVSPFAAAAVAILTASFMDAAELTGTRDLAEESDNSILAVAVPPNRTSVLILRWTSRAQSSNRNFLSAPPAIRTIFRPLGGESALKAAIA